MTYKLGDRVIVTNPTHYGQSRGYYMGCSCTITAIAGDDYLFGLTLEGNEVNRIYFRKECIEYDKNYIVTQILNDL